MNRLKAALLALIIAIPASAAMAEEGTGEPVTVIVDRAKVFRISRPAATVIIGNPSIADATVEDEKTLVLTGRSFGVTNLIVLDAMGILSLTRRWWFADMKPILCGSIAAPSARRWHARRFASRRSPSATM
ncbi:MAG: pilus assembly protein N-terminal domain-containing protein [Nitratireductor sp.]